ncbi:unnamed protein product [Cylicocyclus nassatus]|uniref:C-type lectin domain-containing protein n=1 Tax=Cylicocyclus nassatus TaxID=53992 RepID=A0AA36DT93_CYLNA|nr:unnamed protein product [Cylicocyclus nassatus]
MYSIKLLLVVLIPSLNAFVDLHRTTQLLRGPDIHHGLSHLSVSHAASPARCESGWTLFDKTEACYKVFVGETFEGAENTCNVVGGHLAPIHNFEENRFVAELAKMDKQVPATNGNDFTWIGLQDMTNSKNWTWTDGTKVDFEFWGPNSPKRGLGNCVHVWYGIFICKEVEWLATILSKTEEFPLSKNGINGLNMPFLMFYF